MVVESETNTIRETDFVGSPGTRRKSKSNKGDGCGRTIIQQATNRGLRALYVGGKRRREEPGQGGVKGCVCRAGAYCVMLGGKVLGGAGNLGVT